MIVFRPLHTTNQKSGRTLTWITPCETRGKTTCPTLPELRSRDVARHVSTMLCVAWISLPRVAPDGLLGAIHICLRRRLIPNFLDNDPKFFTTHPTGYAHSQSYTYSFSTSKPDAFNTRVVLIGVAVRDKEKLNN